MTIFGYKLGSQFNGLHFLIEQGLMADLKLLSTGSLNLFELNLLGHLECMDFLAKFVLETYVFAAILFQFL